VNTDVALEALGIVAFAGAMGALQIWWTIWCVNRWDGLNLRSAIAVFVPLAVFLWALTAWGLSS